MKVVRKGSEPIGAMLRRLKKGLEKHGVIRELRAHEFYVKPGEKKRRKKHHRRMMAMKGKQEPVHHYDHQGHYEDV